MRGHDDAIEIVGADANNLRDVHVSIPRNALTAIVGPSGSGKSSLVEQTLAAEAAERMRRYLDVDVTALQGSHVDAYVGATPPILFAGQRAFRASSRTTLGTSTGILRLLRRMFLRFSSPFADDIREPVPEASPESFAGWLKKHASGRATIWAIPVVNQATTGVAAAARLVAAGLREAVVRSETDRGAKLEEGTRVRLDKFKPLRSEVRHTIEAVVAAIEFSDTSLRELEDALSRAWHAAPGAVLVELHDESRSELKRAFTFGLDARAHRVHPRSPVVYAKPDAHLLTFNAPTQLGSGACPTCNGIGVATGLDERSLVIHPERSMHEGAFALWTPKNYRHVNVQHVTIEGLRGRAGFDPDVPWKRLSSAARALVLEGTTELVQGIDPRTKKKMGAPREFEGFRRLIVERTARESPAAVALRTFVHAGPCPTCGGTRWSVQARALRIAGWSIDRLLSLTLGALDIEARSGSLANDSPSNARPLVANLARAAASMVKVGIGHLTSDRGMLDVSDGESRRSRLAGVLASRLAGLLLVLDEPARGLHECDLVSLGDAIVEAARLHTVVLSEHRDRVVRRSDHIVELGPGAGPHGGRVTYAGSVKGTRWSHIHAPRIDAPHPKAKAWLEIDGASIHNVNDANVRIPLGQITCVAGVSGSGKSSFVRGALVPALISQLPSASIEATDFRTRSGRWRRLSGHEHIRALYALDQAPPSVQRRSLVATFLGIAEDLRERFASRPEARRLGLRASDFSTNAGSGRCPRCDGRGTLDDDGECPVCGGKRFGADVLSVRLESGLSYAEFLDVPVSALSESDRLPSKAPALASMIELGIGHLAMGRSLDTLSGGEIQRLRIARALAKHESHGAIFVIDEPAGGLHPTDVERLETALRHIVADGANTVILVEHDPYLLATCDHIVEFGPGSGAEGGRVIATGSPAHVKSGKTPTGDALRGFRDSPHDRGSRPLSSPQPHTAATLAEARGVRAEIRQIMGDDVETTDDDDRVTRPAALVDIDGQARRPLEIGDMDIAIARILLDSVRTDITQQIDAAAKLLHAESSIEIFIHPLLDAISQWGARIPDSVRREAVDHRRAMGIEWEDDPNDDVTRLRASGDRFKIGTHPNEESLRATLRDAVAVGAGYVELIDRKKKVRATICDRLMDLGAAAVGARYATPAHFSRLDVRGACPVCRGKGVVIDVDRKLVVARPSGLVSDERSLDPRLSAILKGVWRSELQPFFRRLADEGLWDPKRRWSDLDAESDSVVMHGFWVRPGHGTFRKTGKDIDGSEVNHWLRWDGLLGAIDSQLHRSASPSWVKAFEASRVDKRCPTCAGSGLGPMASMLSLGDQSLSEWVRRGNLDAFLEELGALDDLPHRAREERKRAVQCLAPLSGRHIRLDAFQHGPDARQVWQRAAERFAHMPLADAD